jgi:hypothetical protein
MTDVGAQGQARHSNPLSMPDNNAFSKCGSQEGGKMRSVAIGGAEHHVAEIAFI